MSKLYQLIIIVGVILFFFSRGDVRAEKSVRNAVVQFEQDGIYDPLQISEDELFAAMTNAYSLETDSARREILARRLLVLKWRRLWESNAELPAETVIVGEPLADYFHPSDNWQWTNSGSHYSAPVNGIARHSVKGVFPYLLPVNGMLLQQVYFPSDKVPEEIRITIETAYMGTAQQTSEFVQAKWTKTTEHHLMIENRPSDFWAGTFPTSSAAGTWHTLTVNLLDLGLCGRERAILGIEFVVVRGESWFGKTIIRRPPVEIRGSQKYHLFSTGQELAFDMAVHNMLPSAQTYTLELSVSDYAGAEIFRSLYPLTIPANTTHHEKLTLNPEKARYLVFDYTLYHHETPVYHGNSAAAVILPNITGRDPDTAFGMMYWDQPGQDMVDLYEKLGVKLLVIFPALERLHLFDPQKFDVMPMIWTLPDGEPGEEDKLRQQVQLYLNAGQRLFSNFWETDLRVPANMFVPHIRRFSEIIKQLESSALTGIGGMAWFNVAYLHQLLRLAKDGPPLFDFLTAMCYNTPTPPEYSGIDQETDALHTLLADYRSPHTEIWNVEWSYFENLNLDRDYWQNTGIAREQIAPYTIRHHLFGFASGIRRMVPGTSIYAGRTPLAKNYGHSMTLGRSAVTRYDLTPLPLLPAYSTLTRMVEGKRFIKNLTDRPNLFCQVYQADNDRYISLNSAKTVIAAWTSFGVEEIALRVPYDAESVDSQVTWLNMLGEPSQQSTCQGMLSLSISPEPIYILLPEKYSENVHEISTEAAEPLLYTESKDITVAPGKRSAIRLTYHLYNPGDHILQGSLRLKHPTGISVVNTDIRYLDDIGKPSAAQEQPVSDTVAIWLEREQHAEVTFEILLPETIQRRAYYEQIAITGQSTFEIAAEFLTEHYIRAQTRTSVRLLPPLQATLRPVLHTKAEGNAPTLQVDITNNSPVLREGTISIKAHAWMQVSPPFTTFQIAPGETRQYQFAVIGEPGLARQYRIESVDTRLQRQIESLVLGQEQPVPLMKNLKEFGYLVSFGVGEGYVIEALVQDQTGYETRQGRGFAFRPAVYTEHPLLIDGQFDEWSEAVPLFVHPDDRLNGLTFFAESYGAKMQWSGLEDFSSAWQMMWDQECLYLAVKVFDDRFVPQHELGSFWDGDSISLQIDPLPDLTDASMLPFPRDLRRIHTFDLGLSRTGPKIRRKYRSADLSASQLPHIRFAGNTVEGGVNYELAIPWEALAPLHPKQGGWMGVSLVFYDDDGDGRETYIGWFCGSGGNGLAREPRLMGDVHFVR